MAVRSRVLGLSYDLVTNCFSTSIGSFRILKEISVSPRNLTYLTSKVLLKRVKNTNIIFNLFRIDTGDDNRVSKEEFTSDKIKASLEKWVGPIEDLEAEFDSIDTNSGGQVPKTNILYKLVSDKLFSL